MDEKEDLNALVKDYVQPLRDALYARAKSPFVGAFVIAWLIQNYRMIYVLLRSQGYNDAFTYIDKAYSVWYLALANFLVFPCAYVFSYLFIVPKLEICAVQLWVEGKLAVRKARRKLEDSAPFDEKTMKSISDELTDQIKSKYEARIQSLRGDLQRSATASDEFRRLACASMLPASEIVEYVRGVRDIDRDVIFCAAQLEGFGTRPSVRLIKSELDKYRPGVDDSLIRSALMNISRMALTNEIPGDAVSGDWGFSVSARGNDFVRVMVDNGLSPMPLPPTGLVVPA